MKRWQLAEEEEMMTLTAQETAEQIVDTLCEHLPGNTAYGRLHDETAMIRNALTTFAQARERAVWQEAAKIAESPLLFGLQLDKPEGCLHPTGD